MRNILLVGVSAIALALGGCGMFERHNASNQSNAGYAPSTSSQAQAAPSSTARQSTAKSPSDMEQSGNTTHRSAARNNGGANRDEVMQAQQKLQSDGLYKGKVDGMMGPRTKQAVLAFQKQNGLKQTGQLDEQTMTQLTSSGSSQSSSTGSSMAPSSNTGNAGSAGTSGPTSTTPSNAPPNSSGTTTKSGTQQ